MRRGAFESEDFHLILENNTHKYKVVFKKYYNTKNLYCKNLINC